MSAAKGLTRPQIAAYFAAAAKAARMLGVDVEAYRRRVMRETCGVDSCRDLRRTDQYERVMSRFASDAEDWGQALRFVCGDAKRLSAMVADCAEQVLLLADSPERPCDYVAGVIRRSRLPSPQGVAVRAGAGGAAVVDVPETSLRTVFQMLDIHRRRLLRRAGWKGGMAFRIGQRVRTVGGVACAVQGDAARDGIPMAVVAAARVAPR